MKNLIYLLAVLFFIACSPKKSSDPFLEKSSLEAIARNNFKDGYEIKYNSNKTFAAVYEEVKSVVDQGTVLRIMVFDAKNHSVIWGRKASRGNVEWESRYKLRVDYFEGNKKHAVIFDAKTREVTYIQ
jgi:hypothetical protein